MTGVVGVGHQRRRVAILVGHRTAPVTYVAVRSAGKFPTRFLSCLPTNSQFEGLAPPPTVSQSVTARTLGLTLGGFLAASARGERLEGAFNPKGCLAEVNVVLIG